MSFLSRKLNVLLPDAMKEKIVKHEAKKLVNGKLKLDGQLDKHVDALAEKVMDKIDASAIFDAKDIYDKFKATKTNKD